MTGRTHGLLRRSAFGVRQTMSNMQTLKASLTGVDLVLALAVAA